MILVSLSRTDVCEHQICWNIIFLPRKLQWFAVWNARKKQFDMLMIILYLMIKQQRIPWCEWCHVIIRLINKTVIIIKSKMSKRFASKRAVLWGEKNILNIVWMLGKTNILSQHPAWQADQIFTAQTQVNYFINYESPGLLSGSNMFQSQNCIFLPRARENKCYGKWEQAAN